MTFHFKQFAIFLLLGLTAALLAARPVPKGTAPPIVGVAHVALFTSNLSAARHFYGDVLGFDEIFDVEDPTQGEKASYFKVNNHQYIEVYFKSPGGDRLIDIAFETSNARALRKFLTANSVTGLGAVHRLPAGSMGFSMKDPAGHLIEFVEYTPNSLIGRNFGKGLASRRISRRIIHAGLVVQDRAVEDGLYRDVLGFHVMWHGGMTDQETDWVDMRVPQGHDWLEYMLNVHNPSPHTLGVMHHLALGVPNVRQEYNVVLSRGLHPRAPQIGRDGKWQLNLFDPDGTRIELMEPKPVRTPCCSPMVLN